MVQLAPCGASHDKLTSNYPITFRVARFCHANRLLSVTCGTRFSVVPDKQVFKEGIDAFVLQAIQFRIFVE